MAEARDQRFREALNVTPFWPHRASICMLCADRTREGNEGLFCLLTEGVVDNKEK